MSKELPYYQFEVAEYLAGDIMICSLEAQGLFSIIKCLYWQKDCQLNTRQVLRRYNNQSLIDELVEEKCLKVDAEGKITISFLKDQFIKLSEKREKRRKAGSKGGIATRNKYQKNSNAGSNAGATLQHLEEKRREEIRIEEKIYIEKPSEILKSDKAYWESFLMKFKKQTPDFEKMLTYYDLKVDEENMEYLPKKLKARLERYAMSWKSMGNSRPNKNLTGDKKQVKNR